MKTLTESEALAVALAVVEHARLTYIDDERKAEALDLGSVALFTLPDVYRHIATALHAVAEGIREAERNRAEAEGRACWTVSPRR